MSNQAPVHAPTLEDLRTRATMTVDEYAALVGVSRGTAYISVRAGEVPSIRVGRRVLVSVPAVLRALGVDTPAA